MPDATAPAIEMPGTADLSEQRRREEEDGTCYEYARQSPAVFAELVLTDEQTGQPIRLAPIHQEWQRLVSLYPRLLVWSSVESGKTAQLSIGRVLWELGRNPSLRIAIVSNTYEQATKIVRAIAGYIERSEQLRAVFPALAPGELWTSSQLIVRRPFTAKDPSVQAFGCHGNITGARIDLLILDDMLDYENCRTAALRQDLWDWYHATLSGRLTKDARVVIVGTAYHPDDLLHRFAKQTGVWRAFRFPVLDDSGIPRWPERWPLERIARKREELGPLEFARQMLCMARDDSESRFKREWIETAMARGRGRTMVRSLDVIPRGYRTVTGVDLAVQRHSAADSTVLFTIGIHPNGTREVLWIESGKWSGPEIISRIIDTHRRFHSIIFVESNAAQDYIVQFTRGSSAVPVFPFTTGRNKTSPEFGVESIAAEMAGGKWIIPCGEDGSVSSEIAAWIQEMLYYDPAGHTGDRLMASWLAREGARKGSQKVEWGSIDLMAR